jgi:hypothetical protein
MMTRIAAALLFGALALSPGLSFAADESSSLDTAIQTAKTPAQHGALALTYHAKAEEARAMAKRHDGMGGMYGQKNSAAAGHCQNIAKKYTGIAEDYDALAKSEEAAAQAK